MAMAAMQRLISGCVVRPNSVLDRVLYFQVIGRILSITGFCIAAAK
jgi:hypothetical protein